MCGPACDKGTQERKSKRRHYYSGEQKLEKIETRRLSNVALENRLEYNGNKWGIITLYSQKIEETMEVLFEYISEEEEECLVIGGDYNARTDNKEGPIGEEEEEGRHEIRNSLDTVTNKEGRILLGKLDERGWAILNGTFGEKRRHT